MDDSFALRFHLGTNHTGGEFMDPGHTYGPWDRPDLFKRYADAEQIKLPTELAISGASAMESLSHERQLQNSKAPNIQALASLLHYSAGITKRIRYGEQVIAFRAAACTGALYHIELYAICGELEGLGAGVYHYDPEKSALNILRQGDYRSWLSRAAGQYEKLADAPLILAFTDMYMRNAIKYQARAYRHAFWDSGTILSQTLALATAHGYRAELVLGFPDRAVSQLLDLADEHEFPLALVAVGEGAASEQEQAELLPLELGAQHPLPAKFPIVRQMHETTSLEGAQQAELWRAQSYTPKWESSDRLIPAEDALGADDAIEEVILRRGSSRRFQQESISFAQLLTILTRSVFPLPLDVNVSQLNRVFMIVNSVEGLDPGTYIYQPDPAGLTLLNPGQFRTQARELALGQDLAGDASVNFYYLCDLGNVLENLGERGYRLAQLEASVMAGRAYLAAYAPGRGATGLTFNDPEVIRFFEPQSNGLQVMFLLALGVPQKKG
jgi:SagB-type dehydrogenase family enzyme